MDAVQVENATPSPPTRPPPSATSSVVTTLNSGKSYPRRRRRHTTNIRHTDICKSERYIQKKNNHTDLFQYYAFTLPNRNYITGGCLFQLCNKSNWLSLNQ